MHLRPLGHLSGERFVLPLGGQTSKAAAERVGFEPTVPLRAHLISNQAPSTARSSLRGALWQRGSDVSTWSHGGLRTLFRAERVTGFLMDLGRVASDFRGAPG